ncbi:tRNA-uridine aminocarboxypropyltransferase [Thalassotalea ponticola]|uniref:tRNA-uridine aminocarboxypropyltransferase n=1 Tax=Thalassotalea ponticola TaxID=1523392 RepID=UPI0025B4AEF9|nr:tRNA-uridine aminocarboxypropyltransferase [Thalassotalea ponticola]MDN3652899.1 tRNA-uridine aminocarboxypropyltransferase [Thalassotalea ponticola]
MSRQYCTRCERPLVTCLCKFCQHIDNRVQVLFLQHPKEQGHSKGSVPLAHLSLQNSQVIVGEDFSHCEPLNKLIGNDEVNVAVLYPSASAKPATELSVAQQRKQVIVIIDATWRKAYKMMQLSTNLQRLPAITLAAEIKSQYVIRKHHKASDVSSLEACAHALGALEGDTDKYQPLLDAFLQFNQWHLQWSGRHPQ